MMELSFLLAPNRPQSRLPLCLTSVGCHKQHYVLRPDGHGNLQLLWTVKGRGSFNFLNGHALSMEEGQGLLLPKDIPHEYYAPKGEPWMLAFLGFDGPASTAIAEGCGLPLSRLFQLLSPGPLLGRLERLWHEVNQGGAGREQHFSRESYALLLELGEAWQPLPGDTASGLDSRGEEQSRLFLPGAGRSSLNSALNAAAYTHAPSARSPADASLIQTIRFMQDHYTEQLCMANLADAVGYSVQHFQRIFKRAYGTTPHAYLQHIRLYHAADWLVEQPSLTVKEIAARLGWEPNYFIRVFRSEFGVSPGRYRQSRGGGEQDRLPD
ncbi:MAG: AraC family transcriptional regulator [Paenibacillaceae bacterium]|jgi:AraC-like DNA-binding protein|nr:AraC family transcriptional regulator [Paenibacillaceae bacterium]